MKITTAICKQEIVDWIKRHPGHITHFIEGWEDIGEGPAMIVKNWIRSRKYKEGGDIIREFECIPYEDSLGAYVTERNGVIASIVIKECR